MRTLLLAPLILMTSLATLADCVVRSAAHTTPLLELYTSEGCSSCPPADRWLSSLVPSAGPAVVPIAFHVDYWNHLGWKDAFADARYTERQRDRARAAGARSVYTPQVVLAGRDFPGWRMGSANALDSVRGRPARAELEVTTGGASARVRASLRPGVRADDVALLVAITQNGVVTKVRAGENRGETLRHDFVVRDLQSRRGWSAASPAAIDTRIDFTPAGDWKLERMNVVAFVQDLRTGEVLQALSAPAVCN